jgi:glycosyltransferase involved in cell wall biosynthesis
LIRVLHIIPTLNKGGAERLTIEICNKLSDSNETEVLLVLMSNDIKYELPSSLNYVVTNSKINLSIWKKNKVSSSNFDNIIKEFKPDIIHSHLFEAEVLSRFKTYPNIVYITHVHDNIVQFENFTFQALNRRKILNRYEKYWVTKQYKKVDNKFISISKDTTRYLIKSLTKSKSKDVIFELSNAIDFEKFYFSGEKTITQKISFIAVGSLVEKKNQQLLIHIASILNTKGVDFEMKILGDGPKRVFLENEIRSRGLSNRVHLLGNVNDVPYYLKQATLFIHTALYEPFGLVLLEAMASGLPIVSLDGKGNRDIVLNGKNGFLLQKNDPELFVKAILDLLNDREKYQSISNYARTFAKNYDIKEYVKTMIEFYKLLCTQKGNKNEF